MSTMREIPEEWEALMLLCQKMQYGEFRIIVQNGKPVRAENVVKTIKLDNQGKRNVQMVNF